MLYANATHMYIPSGADWWCNTWCLWLNAALSTSSPEKRIGTPSFNSDPNAMASAIAKSQVRFVNIAMRPFKMRANAGNKRMNGDLSGKRHVRLFGLCGWWLFVSSIIITRFWRVTYLVYYFYKLFHMLNLTEFSIDRQVKWVFTLRLPFSFYYSSKFWFDSRKGKRCLFFQEHLVRITLQNTTSINVYLPGCIWKSLGGGELNFWPMDCKIFSGTPVNLSMSTLSLSSKWYDWLSLHSSSLMYCSFMAACHASS